jgi:hypothetical protein
LTGNSIKTQQLIKINMVIKELVHSDRVSNQSLASLVLSAASSRKRDRCDAPECSSGSATNNDGGDQDCSFFRSKKRVNSSVFCMPAATHSERREDISDDDDDEELEELVLTYRTTVFREQRQLPETPYSMHFKDEEDDEDGLSPSFVGAHPTILRAKTINEDSSTDYIDPPEMSSRVHHTYEDQDLLLSELDETSNESYESRGVGEDSVSEREQPEWLSGSSRPFAWTLPKKGTEPLFTSVQRESSNKK